MGQSTGTIGDSPYLVHRVPLAGLGIGGMYSERQLYSGPHSGSKAGRVLVPQTGAGHHHSKGVAVSTSSSVPGQ
jgi:hypothetical protein